MMRGVASSIRAESRPDVRMDERTNGPAGVEVGGTNRREEDSVCSTPRPKREEISGNTEENWQNVDNLEGKSCGMEGVEVRP